MENNSSAKNGFLLIWVPIILVLCLFGLVFLTIIYQNNIVAAPLKNFDKMAVSNGFHTISIPNGQHWKLSYEQNHDRIFSGTVRHTSMDHEPDYPIISFDILVTSGDFASSTLVSTDVTDHHFTWVNLGKTSLQGTINLLHTVPMNQDVEDKLAAIKNGDTVVIQGWDILRIDSYDKEGNYIGYWADEGCNTTLVTGVTIQ